MIEKKNKVLKDFLENFKFEVETNFESFKEQLYIKYHRFNTEINQMNNKKHQYLKNLEKLKNDFKQQNDFENLKQELEFFNSFSHSIDERIEMLDKQIEVEDQQYKQKLNLVNKYRDIIKIIAKNNIQIFKQCAIIQEIKNSRVTNTENQPQKPSFFLTENLKLQQMQQKSQKLVQRRENFFAYYFFYKECFNAYLNSVIMREQVSRNRETPSFLFQIYKSINQR